MKKHNNITSLKTLSRGRYDGLRQVFKVQEKLKEGKKFLNSNLSKTQEQMLVLYFKYLEERDKLKKEIEKLDTTIKKEFESDKVWQFRDIYRVNHDVIQAMSVDNYALYMSITKPYTEEYKKALLQLHKDTFDFSIELNKTKKKLEIVKGKQLINSVEKIAIGITLRKIYLEKNR